MKATTAGRREMNAPVATRLQETAPFRPRRLGHANLWVSDYERAYQYYRDVVGFEHAYIQPDNKASFVSNGNTYHDYGLLDVKGPYAKPQQKPGLNHFAFELRNEVELADGYRRAKAAGVQFAALHDHDVAHAVYQNDPDGNRVEIYADVVADWRAARSGVVIKEKPKYVPGESSVPVKDEFFPKDPDILVVHDAVFHPRKVAHVSLLTSNLDRMREFYTNVVGLDSFFADKNGNFVVLKGTASDGDLVLIRCGEGDTPGLHHVGIEVLDEAGLDRSRKLMGERNIELHSEIDHPARKAMTIVGMDGVLAQFFVNRNWRPDALSSVDRKTALALL
jgi:catechol 2,3-dioxygenase